MVDILERPSPDFQDAAATPQRRRVTIELDAEVLDDIAAQGLNFTEHLNGLARFYMDTTQQKARDAGPDAWEPGEMEESSPETMDFRYQQREPV